MASSYVNLGNAYQTRGERDKAIEFHEKSLAIDEKMGLQEGVAINYFNIDQTHQQGKTIEYWEAAADLLTLKSPTMKW